ncbi:MAG: four helix bundle protein [candidate division Zixibacteria bacterium]|nr:four helix bundle protein [candidate division Zixibacteria bacterium]
MFGFEKLDVWHKAVDLTLQIDEVLKKLPKNEFYFFGGQIKRAVLAISTNIAEGTGRNSKKEASYFFNVARGSTYEVASLSKVLNIKGYLNEERLEKLYSSCEEISKMLSGMIKRSQSQSQSQSQI